MIDRLSKIKVASISKIVFVALTFGVIFTVVESRAASGESYKVQALRQTGKQLLDIGYEQYRRGMYANALASLEKAAKYQKYLSVSDVSKLNTLRQKARSIVGGQTLEVASEPVEILTEPTVIEVAPVYTNVEPTVIEPEAVEYVTEDLTQLYNDSVGFYNSGMYAQARVGFERLVNSGYAVEPPNFNPSDYLSQIDRIVPANAVDVQYIEVAPITDYVDVDTVPYVSEPVAEDMTEYIEVPADGGFVEVDNSIEEVPYFEPSDYETVEPATSNVMTEATVESQAKESYIDVIKQKQSIQQSYTKAVVDDAIAKANEDVAADEYSKAIEEISRAGGVVEKNKLLLGDSVYADYVERLTALRAEITDRRSAAAKQKELASRAQAKIAQQQLRTQQTTDRQKRIDNLMSNAIEYQQQQRYEEALAQVQTLLAIDPRHKEALRSEQMLEDILNLRRQLEVKKEMGREEEDLMYDNQLSMIPHANLITYPRNWKDISAKRDKKEMSGLSPADIAVYDLLDTLVDMTAIGPETMLDEAMELVKTSVEPALKLSVRWRDLEENAYIEPDTIVGMQGISGIPLGKALKEVLESVSGGGVSIDYVVEDGVITVATKDSLPAKLVNRVYDVTELIGTPADYRAKMEIEEDISTGSNNNNDNKRDEDGRLNNAAAVMQTIQETVEPDSWFINGGEGMISSHGNKIIVNQTPPIHEEIQELLLSLRESLGQQVSIETRFLFVTENFLEDIGFDMTLAINGIGGKFGSMVIDQGSYEYAAPGASLVPGSLATSGSNLGLNTGLNYGIPILDDLAVQFMLRATQAHRDAKMLTAPRVTVLSSESAYIKVLKQVAYVSDYDFTNVSTSGSGSTTSNRTIADPQTDTVSGGVILNVTPTITADKKYVILEISANYSKSNLDDFAVYSETGQAYPISLPTREITEVRTRVSVPDGGTLLIGGQKLGAEINKEAGVPGLSKIPIFGRLFTNRSKVKDQDILLVLVKPTIILQEEAEREYFAPLE